MSRRVFRSRKEPLRENPRFEERWDGTDKGLITSWECGRVFAKKDPALAERAKNGELPSTGLKGGGEKKLKAKVRYGCLNYLAQWQGLRGEDLDLDMDADAEMVCTKTGQRTIFTGDQSKYSEAEDE
jgi:hypothetical protein